MKWINRPSSIADCHTATNSHFLNARRQIVTFLFQLSTLVTRLSKIIKNCWARHNHKTINYNWMCCFQHLRVHTCSTWAVIFTLMLCSCHTKSTGRISVVYSVYSVVVFSLYFQLFISSRFWFIHAKCKWYEFMSSFNVEKENICTLRFQSKKESKYIRFWNIIISKHTAKHTERATDWMKCNIKMIAAFDNNNRHNANTQIN